MSDIFQRNAINLLKPLTADMVLINWSGYLAQATQISLQYNQPVNRRWTLGTNGQNNCVIYPGRPMGSLQIQRLFADSNENIFDKPGWDPCGNFATIQIGLDASASSVSPSCTVQGGTYTLKGAIVTSYGLTAEAEGLTLIDNINIEFMQLDYSGGTGQ